MDLKKEERYYQPDELHKWFAISSLLFLASIVIMFGNDYIREWKGHQRAFRQADVTLTRASIASLSIDEAVKTDLEANVAAAEAALAADQSRLDELAAQKIAAEGEFYWANMNFMGFAADLDEARYLLEHGLSEGHGAIEARQYFDEVTAKVQLYKLQSEGYQAEIDGYDAKTTALQARFKNASSEVTTLLSELSLLERKLRLIDPEAMTTANRVANVVRDLPVIDFLAPSIKIQQIIVNDIRDNVNFAVVPKVDRCTSCHLGIDNAAFVNAEQPFTTHPNLDLFITSGSAHPMMEFGCTSCHAGRGRGTSFTSAGHMPADAEQAREWEEKYDWERLDLWEEKMFPAQYSEAGCLKCHAGEPTIRGAEKLTLGLSIMEKASCFGCHQIDRFDDWDRRGPNLALVSGKLTKEFAFKWIRNPRSFRHNTWMPSFFNQTNNSSAEDKRRTDTEIHAMVHYLFENSGDVQLPSSVRSGSASRGQALFESVGCQGCHVIEPEPLAIETDLDRMFQRHGPNLTGMGSKATPEWIYTWIRDPQFYNPDSRMPDMRLTSREAADITAYLTGMNNNRFDATDTPPLDEDALADVTFTWLVKNASEADAKSRVDGMDMEEQLLFVGRRSILQYGCFSCHNIPGFEDSKPIGTPLTLEGSKPTHNLDFGSVHEIEHTNYNWFEAKLTNPRIFDRDKVKPFDERLRMPNFNFSPTEVEALTTVLLGLVKSHVHPDKMADIQLDRIIINRGMTVIKNYNCQGCHIIGGQGGQIVDIIGDPNLSPPNLNTQGAKSKPDWLYKFFKEPTTIRPNLTVRMPTFPLADDEWNDIIRAFQFSAGATTTFETPHSSTGGAASRTVGAYLASKDMGDCAKCHVMAGKNPTNARPDWAPDLALAKDRLRAEWIVDWLRDPQAIMPGTKMPQPFIPSKADVDFDGAAEIFPRAVIRMAGDDEALLESLRDYIYSVGEK